MHRQRVFLLSVTLAAAAATPALGQDVAPAIGPANSGTQPAASIPNFSGMWSHPYWPGFEPPASGPGPVTNKLRLREGPQKGVSNLAQLVGDYSNPILKPEAAEVVRKDGEISLAGIAFPSPWNQCWPQGVPYIFSNMGIQMLQQTDKITILYHHNHEFRQVPLNQPHPAQVTPTWHGDSVGHFEGDTLVVQTNGFNEKTFLDATGAPHTDMLVTTERIRKVSPTQLEDVVTMHDPDYYTRDISTRFVYNLRNDVRLEDYVCGEPHRDLSSVAGVRRP